MAKSKTSRSKAGTAKLEPKLKAVVSSFLKLPRKEQRQFVNAVSSDPSVRQVGGVGEADYFRAPRNQPVTYNTEPDASISPLRTQYSVRMRTNPIKGLTFELLVNYLDQWRMGFFRQAGIAWDAIERRDYQLQIVRPKRMKSVARHGYEILIRDDVDDSQKALAQSQKEFLDNFYGSASATTALNPDEEGGFSLLVRQMMDAVGKYYAVHEIVWQPLPNGELTAMFIFCPIWWFEGTRGKLRFLSSEFQIYGAEMPPGEWLVTCGDGIMESCSVLYLMKSLALKSGLAFLDKFGMPGIHGKTDAAKDSPEWNNFVSAVEDFASEWSAVTNRNAEISLVEAKTNGDGGFKDFIAMFDRAITQLWRGGDLGTSSSAHGTGASLQEDESEILETDDAKLIEETLEAKVTKYALAWKFGPDTPALAYIKLRTTPRRNIQDDIAVDTFLSGLQSKDGRGLLSLQATLERYSRPIPKPDEEVLASAGGTGTGTGKPSVPPGATDKNPELANEATLDQSGNELVVEALLAEFRTLNERLTGIASIDDPAVQKQKLAAVLADLDAFKKNLDHDPAVAGAVYKIICASLANGLAGDKPTA